MPEKFRFQSKLLMRSYGQEETGKASQLRIIYNFMSEQSPGEYTEFVKREYRKGGKGLFRLMEMNIQSGLMKPDADRSRAYGYRPYL